MCSPQPAEHARHKIMIACLDAAKAPKRYRTLKLEMQFIRFPGLKMYPQCYVLIRTNGHDIPARPENSLPCTDCRYCSCCIRVFVASVRGANSEERPASSIPATHNPCDWRTCRYGCFGTARRALSIWWQLANRFVGAGHLDCIAGRCSCRLGQASSRLRGSEVCGILRSRS